MRVMRVFFQGSIIVEISVKGEMVLVLEHMCLFEGECLMVSVGKQCYKTMM